MSHRRSVASRWLVAAMVAAGCGDAANPTDPPGDGGAPSRGGALVASLRAEPRTFNRLVVRDSPSSIVTKLMQASLVRIDHTTDDIEPWLAEGWTRSADGLSYTLQLREGVRFSDGAPLTSADVVFSFAAVYDERLASPLADALRVDGAALDVTAPDETTVVIRFPAPYSPGLRMVAQVPILPAHRLADALDAGTLADAWDVSTPPGAMAGLGPFVLQRYLPGERLVFARNPHYWRRDADSVSLPYLDRLTLEIVPDQNAEFLRLEAGQIDFTQTEVRAEDYASLRRRAGSGRIRLADLGVGLDADFLFFNLRPAALSGDPRRAWLQADELRRALSESVDRQVFAEAVYLGLGDPIYGPITPGNRRWHNPDAQAYPYDPARARVRLAGLGLSDPDGDGMLEDAFGDPVRFTLLTQRGHTVRERACAVLQEDLRRVGIGVDVVALEFGALIDRITTMDFDAAYLGFRATDTDPAANLDLWLSSSGFHFWNPGQPEPATPWEGRIDDLMLQQMAATSDAERAALFDEVQQVFAEYVPAIYFAAPRIFIATSARVVNARPSLLEPYMLWNADSLAVAPDR